jgi:PAS domain S-box-containing protein
MTTPRPISLESEAGFRVLFECATIGILVVNQNGCIELSNPCSEKLFGYEAAELIGKPIEILLPGVFRQKHTQHRNRYFEKPKARPMGLGMELFALKKGGTIFPVEISLGHYELEGERLAVAFVTDVTEQVKAKKIVAEREAWFRSMADNSPVMIWVCDTSKGCTYFNNTWLKFTGRPLEEELGDGWASGVHPEDLEMCLKTFYNAFDSRQAFVMEYRLKRHDGKYRWLQDVGKPTFSENIFTGFIGSCSDIHDKRMMQDELEFLVKQRTGELSDALDREKEMNELKSRFVSMASHEFRTPLSVVLSSTALVEKYLVNGKAEKINGHLVKIRSCVGSLTSILNDFLSLDKLEQGKVEVGNEEFDIVDFINETRGELKRKKGQQIKYRHEGSSSVLLDKKKLHYIMINLLSNAIKYSDEQTEIFLNTHNNDHFLLIEVQDHGIGIPQEEQKNLYNKFFRAKNTANIQGTGLGLTIVKRYVELMNGLIRFESKEGEGTTFFLELPQ